MTNKKAVNKSVKKVELQSVHHVSVVNEHKRGVLQELGREVVEGEGGAFNAFAVGIVRLPELTASEENMLYHTHIVKSAGIELDKDALDDKEYLEGAFSIEERNLRERLDLLNVAVDLFL